MTTEQDVKVYFGNLPFTLDEQALSDFASTVGKVVTAEIIKYGKRSKGFGFVTFASKEDATAAINALNEKDLQGRPAIVKFSRPKTENQPPSSKPVGATDQKKPRNAAPKKRIDDDSEEASTLVPASNDVKRGRQPAKPRAPKQEKTDTQAKSPEKPRIDTSLNTSLYVANLPYKVKDNDLFEIFKDFQVKNAYVVKRFGRSKGFGFVELVSTQERDRVLEEVTNAVVNDREIIIKPATSKEEAA